MIMIFKYPGFLVDLGHGRVAQLQLFNCLPRTGFRVRLDLGLLCPDNLCPDAIADQSGEVVLYTRRCMCIVSADIIRCGSIAACPGQATAKYPTLLLVGTLDNCDLASLTM